MIKLVRASESLLSATKNTYTKADLSDSQFSALEALFHLGPMAQKDLAHKLLKTTGNLTMVVRNLQTRGLVRCERQTSDRRFFVIQLTNQGKDLVRRILPAHVKKIVDAFSVLSAAEQEQLAQLCKKLGHSIAS